MNPAALAAAAFLAWLLTVNFAQAGGGRITVDEARRLIAAARAQGFGVSMDDADILAVIEVESGFSPSAFRFEPALGQGSTGLMQVLLSTARDMGYTGPAAGLFDPATNVAVGMKYLDWIKGFLDTRLAGTVAKTDVIAAYNAGVGNRLKGFTNLGYVNRWINARRNYA